LYRSQYKGRFKPKNPGKYRGNPRNIIYRSFLELKMMLKVDVDPNVVWWSSEETSVSYKSPIDGQFHRYFADFILHTKDGKTTMIEVKPLNQTREPKNYKRKTRAYLEEVMTWGINTAKWKYARDYCQLRGWEFSIVTERDLGITYGS
jgi:hypothetical protein